MEFEFEVEVPIWIFGVLLLLVKWPRSGFVWMYHFLCLPECLSKTLELGLEVPLWIFGLLFHCSSEPEVVLFECIISFVFLNVWVKHWSWGWKSPFEYLASPSCCSGEPEVPPGVTHLASVTPLALGWKHLSWSNLQIFIMYNFIFFMTINFSWAG